MILICGRYEGVDERVAKYLADEEISIGDYVLTGGEIPAMAVVDSIARLFPAFWEMLIRRRTNHFLRKGLSRASAIHETGGISGMESAGSFVIRES